MNPPDLSILEHICQLNDCTKIYWYFNYHLWSHGSPGSTLTTNQVSAWRAFCSGGSCSTTARICRFRVSLYCSIFNKDSKDRYRTKNLLDWRSWKLVSWPCFLTGDTTGLNKEKLHSSPVLSVFFSFSFVFSIQTLGFSVANSSQLVTSSNPDSRLTLLTVSEHHSVIKYSITLLKPPDLFQVPHPVS